MKEIPEWKKDTRERKTQEERTRLQQAKDHADNTFKKFIDLRPVNDVWKSMMVSAMDTCNKCDWSLLEFERNLSLRKIALEERALIEEAKWQQLNNFLL